MNTVHLSGVIASKPRISTNIKKGCQQCDFLLDVPFEHPCVTVDPEYRSRLRTYVVGEDGEWIYDALTEGARVEIKEGFIQSWYKAAVGKSYYRIVGNKIDRDKCGDVPADEGATNIARISGFFRKQYLRDVTEDGILRVGISVNATPDVRFDGSMYSTMISVTLFDAMAELVDGKLAQNDKIAFIEGPLQSFYKPQQRVYGVGLIATDIKL